MEEPSTAAAVAASGLMEYAYESIKHIEIVLMEESEEMVEESSDQELIMVEDPIKETALVIEITINRYSRSFPAPETLDDTTTNLYFLEGFLMYDNDDTRRLDELNSLVRNNTVSAGILEEIKKTLLSYSSRIKEYALEVKRDQICIGLELNLLTWYSQDLGELVARAMVDDDDNEEMFERDDEDDVRKPALRSSVEALETKKFEKKEDLELMMKSSSGYSRSCMICLDEFSMDAADGRGIAITRMPCSHAFHNGCIVQWLEKRYTCPICRYEMPTAAAAAAD